MKKNFTLLTCWFVLFLVPGIIYAQQNPDYTIRTHAGNFVPTDNISSTTKGSPVFTNSGYLGKYYMILQFRSLPTDAMRAQMKAAGVTLIDYIPNMAYTAAINVNVSMELLRSFPIRSFFQFTPGQKAQPEILSHNYPDHAVRTPGFVDVTVVTYEKVEGLTMEAQCRYSISSLGASILEEMPTFRQMRLRVPLEKVDELVALRFIQWIECIEPQVQTENLPGRTLHRVNVLNNPAGRNLQGDGINVGIWDEGAIVQHQDFLPSGRVTQVQVVAVSQHSSHCAGTILGRGIINPIARGMAPNASLFSWDFNGNIQTEMSSGIPANNLVVSSHSYGSGTPNCSPTGAGISYSATCTATDQNLNNFPSHIHCHSAGNSQGVCSGGWYTITSSGKPAKNNIVVADITSTEGLSGSSSCGPVADGRIKPEISAMGTSVFSTSTPVNGYATLSGTSMATPGVSGTCALLVQRYKQLNGNVLPPSSLIKNVLCNGAKDLGNAGPDYRFGFGRVNALASVRALEANRYAVNTISTGAQIDIPVTVPAGTARLKVMLTWNDPAGAANSPTPLVNDLDLTVIQGATTTLPWILDRLNPGNVATRGVDTYSNIEQVTIDNPPAGSYTLRVSGTSVPMGPQQYAITWIVDQPYIEVTYPNGNESFNPTSNELITWDNAGVTGNQTVEYSLDNGGSWNTISTTVAATTNRLSWSVPSANTSQALIRISNGSLTDVSDANFKILGTVAGFGITGASCVAGEIGFTWAAVTNATHYDIYKLNETTGEFEIFASNIVGTSHTATGLTPGASLWFYIVAKNNTTNAVSNRSNAINGTVSTGGGGLGAIGSINGNATICNGPTAEPYSIAAVSGATLYTWTAPPGATITSGQGTTNITINYTGASNGNVTVFASAGSCQTPTVTQPVNVGPSSIALPVSGGDQTANACPPNPTPTLTATATVGAGYTVVWYNASSGGSVVGSPTLSSVGTVTYYAASHHTASNCESATRTAVVLTINAAPPATINATGPLTFCQGGSVTLTANAGSSYTWSTGATTQSIVVSTTGNYTVTVTQTGGCTGVATANVVVNPNPVANITAGGPLNFCAGNNVVLTASAGSSWSWSNGATTQSITVGTSGTFTVTVTNSSGCSTTSSSTTTVVSPNPSVVITASPYTSLLPGLKTTLTAVVTPPGSYAYQWFKNGVAIPSATTPSIADIDLDDRGAYSVRVTNTTGLPCANTSSDLVIKDSVSNKLFIYPSPNTGQFRVTWYSASATTFTLNLYDSKGAKVYSSKHSVTGAYQPINMDMRVSGKGVYRVVLFDKTGNKLADGSVVVQ